MNILLGLLLAVAAPVQSQQCSTSTFVHLTSSMWLTLDPANSYDAVGAILTGNVYETLVTFRGLDPKAGFAPFLSEQVPTRENGLLSEDGRTYIFPIRKGVRFHEGGELTADDARYSLLRYMLIDSEGGPAALFLKPILGVYRTRDDKGRIVVDFKQAASAVRAEGDRLIIRLKEPDSAFLSLLASIPITTSRLWAREHGQWDGEEASWQAINNQPPEKSYLHEHMNGTGPFRLEKVDHEHRKIMLARYEGYWRKPAALSRVCFKVVANAGLRLFMLETGDADAGYLETSYRDDIRAIKGARIIEDTVGRKLGSVLFFTLKIDPTDNEWLGSGKLDGSGIPPDFFSDLNVRQGFAYAFDYERYLKEALGGQGERLAGPFPPALLPTGSPIFRRDAAKAEAAFKKAFGGKLWEKGFVLRMPSSADDEINRVAVEVMKASLESLNPRFKVWLRPMHSRHFFQELESRKLPLYAAFYFADYPDPHSFAFGLLHSEGYFPKYQGYSNPDVDLMIERASRIQDPKERTALYRDLSARAAKDVLQIYTYSPRSFNAYRDWVSGFDSKENTNDLNFNGFPYFYSYSKQAR